MCNPIKDSNSRGLTAGSGVDKAASTPRSSRWDSQRIRGFLYLFSSKLNQLTSNLVLCFLIPFLMVLIGRFVIFSDIPTPQPLIEDEFSYLLAGDTFASFRMTNPMHAFWEHFESIHLIVKPSYMSKYPPMQGLILALGQLVFGSPWVAVVISMAIFCGLLPWVFRAWTTVNWAMLGALLATYKIGIVSYWTDSYWGGGAAAIGGALVLGSVKRLVEKSTSGMLAIFSLGSCILANSRPFEGLVFLLGCAGYVLAQWHGRYKEKLPLLAKNMRVSLLVIIIPTLLLMGLYNDRVTGNLTELPYTEYDKQYSIWTPFVWQQVPDNEPIYRHDFIRRAAVEWDGGIKQASRHYPMTVFLNDFIRNFQFYFGDSFYFILLFLVLFLIGDGTNLMRSIFFKQPNRAAMGILLFYCLISCLILDVVPHYTAPAAALIYLAMTMALRTMSEYSYKKTEVGKIFCLTLSLFFIVSTASLMSSNENRFLFPKKHFLEKRNRVLSLLNSQPGQLLVFVHQGKLNDPNDIWVYNQANIDASKIVWANDMTPEKNQGLIDYYGNKRTVWHLNDDAKLTLAPYGNAKAKTLISMANAP
ncbi:hypothetical protein BN59_02802 [Legionella massiliensis]|uniref:Glycosyltransferase RgtA/B/C/D-like domain-containing protein n=1 Tax=Legionella massiliensis TaxID=1034943 RepID=A0A078KZT0_9GAMM|nr:hypothetical protein [Legionella massiliensis]CDZ78492.1 hypothetical protein BN59_02802 [Legionella massiliensis]CEE14230.1 hypothetical protein BN1094_02802 [Legionella massiliensis]